MLRLFSLASHLWLPILEARSCLQDQGHCQLYTCRCPETGTGESQLQELGFFVRCLASPQQGLFSCRQAGEAEMLGPCSPCSFLMPTSGWCLSLCQKSSESGASSTEHERAGTWHQLAGWAQSSLTDSYERSSSRLLVPWPVTPTSYTS